MVAQTLPPGFPGSLVQVQLGGVGLNSVCGAVGSRRRTRAKTRTGAGSRCAGAIATSGLRSPMSLKLNVAGAIPCARSASCWFDGNSTAFSGHRAFATAWLATWASVSDRRPKGVVELWGCTVDCPQLGKSNPSPNRTNLDRDS